MADKHTLYISFSSKDNQKQGDQLAWVDDFIGFLGIFFQRIIGESPEIIKIHESGSKAPASLAGEDALIIISSENYIKEGLHKKDAPLLSDPNKVFKVNLQPIRKSDQPAELRSLHDTHMYKSVGKKAGEYQTMNSIKTGQDYWLKVIDLAFEISMLVYHKFSGGDNSDKTIFLAECSYDQVGNRGEIKRELQRYGFKVIPEKPFSSDLAQFEKEVADCLQKAQITVQIIGEEYGEVPNGTDKSIVEIQNDIATEYYKKQRVGEELELERLIWMPLFLKPKTDQQKLYLDRLREDIASTEGAEIIQTPLEVLKTVIHTRLQILEREKQESKNIVERKSDEKSVYLLYDQKDEKDIASFVQSIQAKNIKVVTPNFDGKQMDLLQEHRDRLIETDGVLLYANKNINWVNSKLNDVIKAPGFGKAFAFDAKAVYINNDSIPKDKIANFGDILILNGDNGAANIDSFTDKIVKS